ncbi:hypothetical protein NKDENANG_01047 [Candidatus Entotheonellaceae bacterium PAL068K]
MPIYEYRCNDCCHEFERMQKFSEPPTQECPSCTGVVQKLISRSAFHLKGSGWYATDYARKGSQNGNSSTNDTSQASESKSAADADSSTSKDASKTASADTTTS